MVDNITPTRGHPGFWAAGVVSRYGTMVDLLTDKPWIQLIAAKVRMIIRSYFQNLEDIMVSVTGTLFN